MWETIWASRFCYWLLTRDVSRSCLHSSRTHRVCTLKVRWWLYYEFMCFDVPKVVQSPEWDRGHDEESRNGRDVKIDILDDYIRTSERFQVIRLFFGGTKELREYEEEVMGLMGLGVEERGQGAPPPSPNRIGLGGRPPFPPFPPSPSFSFSSFLSSS